MGVLMNKRHRHFFFSTFCIVFVITIPLFVTAFSQNIPNDMTAAVEAEQPIVKVFLNKEKKIVSIRLEDYVKGVVSREVSPNFHPEALKAQALAVRTYVLRILKAKSTLPVATWGAEAKGAHVSDTVQHQAYVSDQELMKRWGKAFVENNLKVADAVSATRNKYIAYKGEPIYAAFHSTSNGKTEDAKDYYPGIDESKYPYLRSVNSEWDKRSPEYQQKCSFNVTDVIDKLQKKFHKTVAAKTFSGTWLSIVSKTEGNRIAKVRIGDQTFTGREVREALALPSSDFSCELQNDQVTFTVRGFGHGVGMSQWGVNIMGHNGKTYEEMIGHYYQGTTIEKI